MNQHTLYFIQSDFHNTLNAIETLKSIYQDHDAIVLMGESVLHAEKFYNLFSNIFVLDVETENLPVHHQKIQIISYTQFASLCLEYTRNMRLK